MANVLARMRLAQFTRRAKALFRGAGLKPLAGMQILSPGTRQHSVPRSALWSSAPMMYALGRPARAVAAMHSGLTPLAQPRIHTFWRSVAWLRQRTTRLDLADFWLGAAGLLLLLSLSLWALRRFCAFVRQVGYQKGNHERVGTRVDTEAAGSRTSLDIDAERRDDARDPTLPPRHQQDVRHQYQDYEI